MKRLWIFLILIFFISSIYPTSVLAAKSDNKNTDWPEGPNTRLSSDSAVVMDLSSGLVLYEKNSNKKQYPASTTKVMTTLLALENCSLGETVTFSHNAVFGIERDSSHIGIDVGEKLTVEQCLYAIMLASANEVSAGIGEHVAGSIPSFAKLMNAKAKQLGCKNTHFVNANGLHDKNHYTTAYDLALISRAAMGNSTFRKITGTKSYNIPPTNIQKETRYLMNHHQMLVGNKYPKYKYKYCIGGKTGYTTNALSTLVTFAKKDGMELVCVIMRAAGPTTSPNEYSDTTNLLDYCFENFERYSVGNKVDVMEAENPLFTKFNPFFDEQRTPLRINDDASVILPKKANFNDVKKTIEYYHPKELGEGDNIIGKILYTYNTKNVGSSDIVYNTENAPRLESSIPVDSLLKKQKSIFHFSTPILIGGMAVLFIILISLYSKYIERKRRQFSYYRNRNSYKNNYRRRY